MTKYAKSILRRVVALCLVTISLIPLFLVHTNNSLTVTEDNEKDDIIVATSTPKTRTISSNRKDTTLPLLATEHDNNINHWVDGCYHVTNAFESSSSASSSPPSGIVVVLGTATDDRRTQQDTFRRICKALPTQVEYFLEPQGLDMLFVIQEEIGWTTQGIISCLKLEAQHPTPSNHTTKSRTWKNLDGTTITTTPFYYNPYGRKVNVTRMATIYVASTITEYPQYIQKDPAILKRPITPKSCEAPRKYIQATRWYTRELLHLGILQEYDYFLKIDTDIIFVDTIPFHILQDMKAKDAVFGHTAEYHPKGSKTCALGIHHAVMNFTNSQNTPSGIETEEVAASTLWKGSHCSASQELESDVDWYYTNFIIGKVDFWQSPWVLKFSNFLNEFQPGFFAYRWTDQIFWHNTMGLFLRNYQDYVVDYTNLRCMPDPNCWLSSYNFKQYGQDAWHRCENGGYFLHPKDYRIQTEKRKPVSGALMWNELSSPAPLFRSTYEKDCSAKTSRS